MTPDIDHPLTPMHFDALAAVAVAEGVLKFTPPPPKPLVELAVRLKKEVEQCSPNTTH